MKGVVETKFSPAAVVMSFAPVLRKPYEREPHIRLEEGAAETGSWIVE